jgi:hypothetical protein
MARIINLDDDTVTLELYFSDLDPDAQQMYLDFQGLKSPKDGNLDLDIVPIHLLTRCRLEELDGQN